MAEISTSEEQTPSAAASSAATGDESGGTSSPVATPNKKKGSVADRVAWLQNAFNKDSANTPSKRDIGLESSTSVSDRKRWMEEEAFRKHLEEKGMDTAGTSHASVVAERRRWLDEQAERNRLENEKNQINKQGSPRGAARSSSATQLNNTAEDGTNNGDVVAENQDGVKGVMGSDAKDEEVTEEAADTEGDANQETDDKVEAEAEEKDINKEDTENDREETAIEDSMPEESETEPPLVEESPNGKVLVAEEKAVEEAAAPIAASKPTRPSSQDPPIKTTAATMMRATETTGTGGSAMPCLFSSPVFAQQRDQMEFFLPAACSCPKCRAELAAATAAADGGDEDAAADPTSLKTILRPWQVDFLASEGITTAQALVNVEKDAESRQKLCKQMKRWRKERDLPAKTISCLMACRIWAKTSEEALKNAK